MRVFVLSCCSSGRYTYITAAAAVDAAKTTKIRDHATASSFCPERQYNNNNNGGFIICYFTTIK